MDSSQAIHSINLDNIIPNRFQPRLTFDEQGINDLAASIKEHGIIQPLVLRRLGDKYEIIAGERRYKASVLAGLTEVPAIISNLDDNKSAEVALVENVQRRNLSSIEEAKSYRKILDKGHLTQDELAGKIGVTQSTIANKLRLLNLSQEVQNSLLNEKISERHARSLLQLTDFNDQNKMLDKIIVERLTVRQLDEAINQLKNPMPEIQEPPVIESVIDNFSSIKIENPFVENILTSDTSSSTETTNEEKPVEIFSENNSSLENIFDIKPVTENLVENLEAHPIIETLDIFSDDLPKQQEDISPKTSTLLNIFEKSNYPSLEDEKMNLSFELSSDDILDEDFPIKSVEQEIIKEPEIIEKVIEVPLPEPSKPRVIEGDLESVSKALKDLELEIKNANFKIITEEFDFEDLFQIIIKIDKK